MINEKILLVDDDEDDQLIFKDALKEISFAPECLIASNGWEGLKILANEKSLPAMIFLDLNMPLMNGGEFLLRIKKHPDYKQIQVVIFSTSNNPADKANMLRMGANLFISKTPDFNQLKERLIEILRR